MATDWRSLVEKLAVDDPFFHSMEGVDDGCFWCDTPVRSEHRADCAWIEARQALGLPLGEGLTLGELERHTRGSY